MLRRPVLFALLAFAVLFAVFEGFEIAETIGEWSHELEFLEIDDMVLAALLALTIFAWLAYQNLKRQGTEIESAQQLLQTALDSITDGVALYDKDERLLFCNRRYAANLATIGDILKPGLKLSEEVAALAERGHYIGAGEGWVEKRLRAFRALEPSESCQHGPDGGERWFASRHYRTGDGGTFLIRSDITERKRAEQELESSRQLLQAALDSITDGIALFDKDERLVMFNESYARKIGPLRDIFKPGLRFPEYVRLLSEQGGYARAGREWVDERVRKFRTLESIEIQRLDPDGGRRWIDSRHYRTRDGGTFLISVDITRRKRAEAELSAAREILQTALDSMTDGAALFDKDERLVLFNENYTGTRPQLRDFLKPGLTFAEIIGHLAEQGGYFETDKDWVKTRLHQFRTLKSTEIHACDPDGRERWFNVHHYRTRDGGTFLVRTDITERKRAEAELESARQLLLTALDSMTGGAALLDKDERLVLWNEKFPLYPESVREVLKPGAPFREVVEALARNGGYVGVDATWVDERMRRFRSLEPVEMCLRDSTRRAHWFVVHHYRTRDGGTFLVRTDITERKRAEQELASARQLLQTALDSMTDGVALFDKDERLVLWNEGFVATSPGLRKIVKTGITFSDMVAAMSAEGRYLGVGTDWVETRLRRFRALESTEVHVRDPDGRERWAYLQHYRTRDGGTFLVRSDITERKRAEQELTSARQLLQTALDGMTDGVALYDRDERLVLWNENYTRNFPTLRGILKLGITFPEIVRILVARQSYVGEGEDYVDRRLRKFRALETVEMQVRDFEGIHWLIARHHRTRDGGTLLVLTEITDRVLAMAEIERARVAAEVASEAKTKFLASMSHELRTPLNAILGFTQMLEMGEEKLAEEKRREYLAIIHKSGRHLLDLVTNILELSKIESQDAGLNVETLAPAVIAQHCLDMVRDEAKRREVEIVDRIGALRSDVRFMGDPMRVRQVLLNLLSNAVKYNRPGGHVTLSCARNCSGLVRFTVADSGLGIPPERHGEVFQPFRRLGREAGAIEGSGIGLALARQLIERMGGSIGFESAPGQGSTFWFELPEAGNAANAKERA